MKKILRKYIPENVICQARHIQNFSQYKTKRNSADKYIYKSFDKHKCIFVHIPKTGGISVARALFDQRGGHMTARYYKQLFGVFTFNKYFSFAFVRNPYSRLFSAYNFLMEGGYDERDKKWAAENIIHYETFHEFVKKWLDRENIYKKNHFVPQSHYVCNQNFEIQVDFIGRFEKLNVDFQEICNKLNIDSKLPHYNSSSTKKNWRTFYDKQTLKMVEDIYQKDFEAFGYDRLSKYL